MRIECSRWRSATNSYATDSTGSKFSCGSGACATKGWARGNPKAIEDLGDRRLLDDGGDEPEPPSPLHGPPSTPADDVVAAVP